MSFLKSKTKSWVDKMYKFITQQKVEMDAFKRSLFINNQLKKIN